MNRRNLLLTGAAAAVGALAGGARAQSDNTLRLIVPYAPGGSSDRAARIVADKLTARLGGPVVVENKTGAGGRLAMQQTKGLPASQNVLVLKRNIGSGEAVGAADFTVQSRDAARLVAGVIADPALAVGRVARRPLLAGSVLSSADVASAVRIRNGDNVDLVSRSGGIEVRVAGRALGAAGENERLNVENLSSRKIVQGVVDGSGAVLVNR